MQPLYNFNINPQYSVDDMINQNIQTINSQIEQLQQLKSKMINNTNPVKEGDDNLWSAIDKEVNSLTDEQKAVLMQDSEYIDLNNKINAIVQAALIDSVKDKVMNTDEGKGLLARQLDNIKNKKSIIIEQSNNEIRLFKQFQEAVKTNPNLTYTEFINSLN